MDFPGVCQRRLGHTDDLNHAVFTTRPSMPPGSVHKGTQDAVNESEVRQLLRSKDLFPKKSAPADSRENQTKPKPRRFQTS